MEALIAEKKADEVSDKSYRGKILLMSVSRFLRKAKNMVKMPQRALFSSKEMTSSKLSKIKSYKVEQIIPGIVYLFNNYDQYN